MIHEIFPNKKRRAKPRQFSKRINFSAEVQIAKRLFKKCHRDHMKDKDNIDRRQNFICEKKKYRKALYFTKKKALEMGLSRLAELENNDTKTFWSTIKKILRPPDNSMASIKPVQWHFRSLLQNHTPDGTNKQFSDYIGASLSTLEGVSIANEELNKPISLSNPEKLIFSTIYRMMFLNVADYHYYNL